MCRFSKRRLLAAGAHVNARDRAGATPAHYAAVCDHADSLVALVEAGADVNTRDNRLQTVLFWAVTSLPCTCYLLTRPEMDLFVKNVRGETADEAAEDIWLFDAARAIWAEVRFHSTARC